MPKSDKKNKEEEIKQEPTKTIENEKNEDEAINADAKYFEMENKYFRVLADLENTRKRLQKEKQETVTFAIENTISEFLNIFDNFENALKFAKTSSKEVENWAKGFEMILTQFRDILHSHGIVAFHSKGNIFDPHFHEAMEIIETNDYPDGSIIEELAKGYKSANRTIRAARVKVARNITEKKEEKTEKTPKEDIAQENKS
ncbi:MAG: Protein GrpE [Candidatus Anoxychlamydiales bacterium]|nr:Protein GrpE [Candidatus Anoxychlamydiales bacterium]